MVAVGKMMVPASGDSVRAAKLLVSACLAGQACRYDGRILPWPVIVEQVAAGLAVPICPEVEGGLGIPREPAEIVGGTGEEVLDGTATVITRSGRDVTSAFLAGAEAALALARAHELTRAILKEGSPSCGVSNLRQRGQTVPGCGVTAARLRRAGIEVEAVDP